MENKNAEDKDPTVPEEQVEKLGPEAVKGKKAIDAAKIATGENPQSAATKTEEKKDASHWRNEG